MKAMPVAAIASATQAALDPGRSTCLPEEVTT